MPGSPEFFAADFPGDITLDHVIPAAAAEFAPLPSEMRPELVSALATRGIERLYTHQADAYRAVRAGRHLVVVTPTASPLPVSDQSAGPGPARRAERAQAWTSDRRPSRHVRRRHRARTPHGHPRSGARRDDEPGHAPYRHPSPPHALAPAVLDPRVRRHR